MSSGNGGFDPGQIVFDRMRGNVAELSACLERHDLAGAFAAIEQINAAREESIYHGLGLLARGLHTAIVTFQVDDYGKHYLAHGPDNSAAAVTSQLDNVVRMSEESTRRTLNILDASMPMVKAMREDLDRAAAAGEAGAQYAEAQRANLEALEHNLVEILMAQGYQDLAGQAIRKVNGILESLQRDLIALLTHANEVKSLSEPCSLRAGPEDDAAPGESDGSEPPREEVREAAMAQDAVDDLLASLGF